MVGQVRGHGLRCWPAEPCTAYPNLSAPPPAMPEVDIEVVCPPLLENIWIAPCRIDQDDPITVTSEVVLVEGE